MATKQAVPALRARRDLVRLRIVSGTIVKHGFGELLLKSPLGRRLLARGEIAPDEQTVHGSAAQRFARMLGSLGPTFTKLGQILSMRHDLLSREWIEALQQLQDKAPVVPFEEVSQTIEAALGMAPDEAFAQLDPVPLATASIGQVHRAVTHEGEHVVVKVQRPGIEEVMRGDLSLLYMAAQVLEASIDEMRLMGVTHIVREFERGLLRELDFREELGNLLRMRSLLDPARALTVPRPFPDLSDKSVLTMELFPGRSIRVLEPESELAQQVVDEIVHAFCKQVFVDGFFHGDPHAGNLLVSDTGQLCMIDLGLMGTLTAEQRTDLVTLLLATATNDSSAIARVLLKMGTPTQRVSLLELRSEIERIRAKYLEGGVHEIDSAGFAHEFTEAAQKFRIKLASEYTLLVKSVATIEAIVRKLHPGADVAGIARQYLQQTLTRRLSPQDLLRGVASEVSTLGSLAHRLPEQLDQLLHDFETGNLQVRAVTPELHAIPQLLHQSASRLALSLFASSLTIAAALVLPADLRDTLRSVLCALLIVAAATAWWLVLATHFLRGRPIRLSPLLRLFRRG